MSVVNQNMFSLLAEEESVAEVPKATSPPAPAPTTEAPVPRQKGGRATVNSSTSRGGKNSRRGDAPVASGEPIEPNPNEPGERFDHNEGRTDRGHGRGRGRGGRGGRGHGDGENQRGRPYDKHSQTGKVDTEKKIDQGWGADKGDAEFAAETQGEADAQGERNESAKEVATGGEWDAVPATDATAWGDIPPATDAGAWGDVPVATDAGAWGDVPVATDAGAWGGASGANADDKPERKSRREEEEDNTLTLDQYLAKKKAEESSALPKAERRQIADNGEWKDAVPLLRDEEENVYFVGKTKTAVKPRTKKEEKVFIEIEARFERPGGHGRGGRGRGRGGDRGGDRRGDRVERGTEKGRGGRGRGGRHGESNGRANAVDVDDQSAFPSLA